MVTHQFYTHLNGVLLQVVKHSASATYISHLYNDWNCRPLPAVLHLQGHDFLLEMLMRAGKWGGETLQSATSFIITI